MADERIVKLAHLLTNYSVKIKKGDYVVIQYGLEAKELALECYKNVLKLGGIPIVHVIIPGFDYAYYKNASDDQLKTPPLSAKLEAKKAAANIRLYAEHNTRELSNVDPRKIALRRKTMSPFLDTIVNKENWVLFDYPTAALAQDADMSLAEFEDFVFNACLVDWAAEEKRQEKLKKILDDGKEVRIIGKNTDLTFSIKGRQGIKCCGRRNMPDGEVFIAPVETSTEGYIEYSFPAIYMGREVSGISLKFHKGAVVEAKAEKNEAFLKEMINMDKGAKYLGEFGIGLNYNITKFVRQILFDEKIGGSIHLALGRAYKEGGGRNDSALHWDMIKDLRDGGKILIDGKVIQENGKFTVPL